MEYDIYGHILYWLTNGPCYNTTICAKLYGTVFKNILEIQELADIILCVLLINIRKNRHHFLIKVTSVVVNQ